MTQQKEEPTQDEFTTQRQDVTELEAVGHEPDDDGGKIYVKHQGKLQSMTEGLRHMTIEDGDVYTVHGGKIMNPEAVGRLRDNAIVHVVNKMPGEGKKKGKEINAE